MPFSGSELGGGSSFDRVKSYLRAVNGDDAERLGPLEDISADLADMVRRVERVRTLSDRYGAIELSPYMLSLLKVVGTREVQLEREAVRAAGM